jgi:endonuclease-3
MHRRDDSCAASSSRQTRSLRSMARKIDVILTALYGRKEIEGEEEPVDTLVETILSQNTTDKNSHRAFQILKRAYPRWEDMIGENPKRIAGLIRSGGLADMKAERILDALEFIRKSRGELCLDFLREMTPSQADQWLAQMKGVGPKTRGIILLFALRLPAFPVDTHIHRVTKRLGLIGQRVSREKAQEELAKLVPQEEFFNFHINLIEHGRAVCQARKPRCNTCKIRQLCDYYSKSVRARS